MEMQNMEMETGREVILTAKWQRTWLNHVAVFYGKWKLQVMNLDI